MEASFASYIETKTTEVTRRLAMDQDKLKLEQERSKLEKVKMMIAAQALPEPLRAEAMKLLLE